jgi:hypothetical protein
MELNKKYNNKHRLRFQVLAATRMKMVGLRVVAPYNLADQGDDGGSKQL